jgi:hypothetical protein
VQALNILEIMGQQAKPALPALKQFASLENTRKSPQSILDKNFDYDLRAAKALIIKLESGEKK